MMRGFSLPELLVTVSMVAMVMLFTFPRFSGLSDAYYVQNESRRLLVFLQTIRLFAEHSNKKWLIFLDKKNHSDHWCVIAIEKDEDMSLPISCEKRDKGQHYQPFFTGKTQLISQKGMPFLVTIFNGVRGSSKPHHFILQAGEACVKFVFNNTLNIKTELKQCELFVGKPY